MFEQIRHLLTEAWRQLSDKLAAIKELLSQARISPDFLQQERARFSLNNRIIQLVSDAMERDELGPTNTQYDVFNALSRVATHTDSLSLRQRRTVMRLAGELGQSHVHRCSQCGTWLVHTTD